MNDDAVRRVTAATGDIAETLAVMPGADLATRMLEVSRKRAEVVAPTDVLRRYGSDRFVRPATVDGASIREASRRLFDAVPNACERVTLAPLVPLGTHRIAGVAQSRVVSTVRGTEVAANPTNGLALEAAVRRRALLRSNRRSAERVTMAASQRVVRAQTFEGAASFAHFELFGMVTAGRDTGNLAFERETIAEHVRFAVSVVRDVAHRSAIVELTDLDGEQLDAISAGVRSAIGDDPAVEIRARPDRAGGRGYYDRFCFKVLASVEGEPFELADGGLVDWTQRLVESRKERLTIGGIGVERLVMAMAAER